MARAVWRARQRIHDEAPSELSRSVQYGVVQYGVVRYKSSLHE